MALPTPKKVTGLFDYFKKLNEKRLDKKFDIAEDEARKQGVDVLGLDIDNTATDRALAMKEYGLDYNKTLKRPLYHGTISKFEKFDKKKSDLNLYDGVFTTYRKDYADAYARANFKDDFYPNSETKVLVAPKEKVKTRHWNTNYPPTEHFPNKGKRRYIYRHMRTFDEPEYLRYKPYVKGGSRKQASHFNPKMLGLGGAGATVSGLLSAEEMPSSDQDLSRFTPKKQPEFRQAPISLLDKAKKYAADSYEYAANEGGPVGKFLYSGGAEALKDIEQGTTPMVKTGRLPAMPTGAALANLLELLQL
jgi:hypothetical protein